MSTQTTPQQITDKEIVERHRAAEFANALRQIADFAEANPGLAAEMAWSFYRVNVPVSTAEQPREVIAEFARAAARSGAKVDKDFGEQWAGVTITFGPATFYVYSHRADVCERVVVGTEEVTKEVPAPEALAAVPLVTVTETVEKVEWRCHPLLADAVDDQKAAAA